MFGLRKNSKRLNLSYPVVILMATCFRRRRIWARRANAFALFAKAPNSRGSARILITSPNTQRFTALFAGQNPIKNHPRYDHRGEQIRK